MFNCKIAQLKEQFKDKQKLNPLDLAAIGGVSKDTVMNPKNIDDLRKYCTVEPVGKVSIQVDISQIDQVIAFFSRNDYDSETEYPKKEIVSMFSARPTEVSTLLMVIEKMCKKETCREIEINGHKIIVVKKTEIDRQKIKITDEFKKALKE